MFVIGNLLEALATLLNIILQLYLWVIIARAILSWVSPDPYNPIVKFLYSITEPVLYRVRRFIPCTFGGIDFSPLIVMLAVIFLQQFLVSSLNQIAFSLR